MILLNLLVLKVVSLHADAFLHQPSMQSFEKPPSIKDTALFGYSISYEPEIQSLIVSAPVADSTGQVYVIHINEKNSTKTSVPLNRNSKDIRHDFWYGATVRAGPDFFVACSPRYTEIKYNPELKKKMPASDGICYKKIKNNDPRRMYPMTQPDRFDKTDSKFDRLMDTLGWSIDVTSQNDVLVGGPAMHFGRALVYRKASGYPTLIKKQNYNNPVHYNFGYSVASGKFFSDEITYAVSTTFGEIGRGKVYFYNYNLDNIGAINDDTIGSMFGAALCYASLGSGALLIGAPAFSENYDFYDVGATYVYVSRSGVNSNEMTLSRKIVGKTKGSYFGYAIANLGDMDGDFKDEIAIAAPYEDDGKGAVYIYTGEGILKAKALQKIQPKDFKLFGFSLAVVKDYNDNGCNELAITSLENNKVLLFNSVAFVTIILYTKFPDLQNHKNKTHFEFKSCIDVLYPEKPKEITADVIIKIVTTDKISHLIEAKDSGDLTYEISLNKMKSSYCKDIGVKSILTPVKESNRVIAYNISATLKSDPLEIYDFDISRVLLSEHSNLHVSGEQLISDCGGQKCMPDLKPNLTSTIPKPYIIGSSNMEQLSLSIENLGQTAYSACAEISVHSASLLEHPVGCKSLKGNSKFLCKPFQPIRSEQMWTIHSIQIDVASFTSENDILAIQYDVYNDCNNKTDKISDSVSFILQNDIENIIIKGQTYPEEVVNMTKSDVNKLGKKLEHVYTIYNDGKTNWTSLMSEIILEKVPYVNYSGGVITISKDRSSGIECSLTNSTWSDISITALCPIGDLNRKQEAIVTIVIEVMPNTLDFEENKNVTFTTEFSLLHKDKKILNHTMFSLIKFVTVPIALWIIIVSCVIGLIIFAIITFAMFQAGFLRRKNRDKLEGMKREVHRQSMRRSMMGESMRCVANRRSIEDRLPLNSDTENSKFLNET